MTDDWAQRRASFGRAAELYDRRRPSYPEAAVDHVLSAARDARTMVEIGAGTGKATVLFARRGLSITAVEPAAEMAEVAKRNVPSAEVVVARFEEWDPPSHFVSGVDLVVSAQAWHWVDHAVGLPKAASLLRPGSVMAVMANVPRDGAMDMQHVIEPVFESKLPGLMRTTGGFNWDGHFLQQASEFQESGLFDVLDPWQHDWEDPLDSHAFGELIRTHSDYLVMEPAVVDELVAGLVGAIDAAGGTVVMWYRTRVLLAIRR